MQHPKAKFTIIIKLHEMKIEIDSSTCLLPFGNKHSTVFHYLVGTKDRINKELVHLHTDFASMLNKTQVSDYCSVLR